MPGSRTGEYMWDLWWIKLYWGEPSSSVSQYSVWLNKLLAWLRNFHTLVWSIQRLITIYPSLHQPIRNSSIQSTTRSYIKPSTCLPRNTATLATIRPHTHRTSKQSHKSRMYLFIQQMNQPSMHSSSHPHTLATSLLTHPASSHPSVLPSSSSSTSHVIHSLPLQAMTERLAPIMTENTT
jgi:hypothetical protein